MIIIWLRKTKRKRYALKSIKYNKVNNIFLLSVSKDCASLICSRGICPRVHVLGGIYIYMYYGISVEGGGG